MSAKKTIENLKLAVGKTSPIILSKKLHKAYQVQEVIYNCGFVE